LGSNQGDRKGHLDAALKRLARLPRTALLRATSYRRSRAVGPGRQPDFLNAAALLSTRLSPMGLLVELKRIEAERGRRPGRLWRPRPLDLDIVWYQGVRLRSRFLTLPHPRAAERDFVSEPLRGLGLRASLDRGRD